ncbi:MAG: hypothetical protein PHY47_00415 [Lachnospiraceae bacterium]|nr:hypothetical protein [Lachnospiraceae bacterium]
MIKEIKKDCAIQECNCGGLNELDYKEIKYIKNGLEQFRLPVCSCCKARIEFVIFGTNMTTPEFQLMVKMKELGLMD